MFGPRFRDGSSVWVGKGAALRTFDQSLFVCLVVPPGGERARLRDELEEDSDAEPGELGYKTGLLPVVVADNEPPEA